MSDSRLIIYDTSNFTDFPIGGQLTSVSNFLHFLCSTHPDRVRDVVLVGVTKDEGQVGKWSQVRRFGAAFPFLPVACAGSDPAHTAHSLRLAYAKGLLRYGRLLHIRKKDCNYVQTPEACGPIRILRPGAQIVIFSHGSYANMQRGFRFFRNNRLIRGAFESYLKHIIRTANLIFVLDNASLSDYSPYTRRLVKAGNSVALPQDYNSWQPHAFSGRLLFVGRLSKDKGVAGIMHAMEQLAQMSQNPPMSQTSQKPQTLNMPQNPPISQTSQKPQIPQLYTLTIVGDGEKGDDFRALAKKMQLQTTITFTGAVPPSAVAGYMAKADILVMNSDFEGVPMVILEAFAQGLPVISTDVGGIGETVSWDHDAVRTDGSPASIAAAVQKIGADYEKYASAAHAHAADYSYLQVNQKVYENLIRFWR